MLLLASKSHFEFLTASAPKYRQCAAIKALLEICKILLTFLPKLSTWLFLEKAILNFIHEYVASVASDNERKFDMNNNKF